MGQAAVPLLIASTGLSMGASVYQNRQQNSAIKQQRDQAVEQTRSQARDNEIARLRQARQIQEQNVLANAASGFGLAGSPALNMEVNANLLDEDLTIIKGNESRAIGQIQQNANNALHANNINTFVDIAKTGLSAGMGYNDLTKGTTAAKKAAEGVGSTGSGQL